MLRQSKKKIGEPSRVAITVRLKPDIIESLRQLGDDNRAAGIERLHSLMIHMCQGDSYDVAYKKACGIIGV